MKYSIIASLTLLCFFNRPTLGFNSFFAPPKPVAKTSPKSKSPMFEYLKFDGQPKFDVLQKTKDYVENLKITKGQDESMYADDYLLRGPVIGPLTRADLAESQKTLGLAEAYSDLNIETFGYTIDPENPYRCFYFQRWRGINDGDLKAAGTVYPATNMEMESPVTLFCVVFNPEGKIVYEQVGAVVDRLEGNTAGKAAVFGMLHNAGVKLNAIPGDLVFSLIQRLGHLAGNGRGWTKEEDLPEWWTSTSRGADATEQN